MLGRLAGVSALSLLLTEPASSQSASNGPREGTYACNVYSYGSLVLARQIRLSRSGTYEHIPIGTPKSDWGTPGSGRFTVTASGAPLFQGGPLEGSKVEGYSFDGKSSRFSLQGPTDSRPTSCFGPAYHRRR